MGFNKDCVCICGTPEKRKVFVMFMKAVLIAGGYMTV
jgi:hypothetical protein